MKPESKSENEIKLKKSLKVMRKKKNKLHSI